MWSNFILYLIQVNIALILLYSLYRLFFQRDTFFHLKRFLLLSGFVISLSYPFMDFSMIIGNQESINRMVLDYSSVFNLPEVVISSQTSTDSIISFPVLLSVVYMAGALFCFWGVLVQLVQIVRFVQNSQPKRILGCQVYISPQRISPFSFCRWIFLSEGNKDEKDLKEIILHENSHVEQYHSLDIIFCDLMCIFCWFNPLVWLMKRDIRMNLEYLADRSVMSSGCDVAHYQLHLLRLSSYHRTAVKLSNNFNVSPLKKRIKMMNKKNTSWFGLAKYALFVPVVAILLLFNNTRVLSNASVLAESFNVNNPLPVQVMESVAAQQTTQSAQATKPVVVIPAPQKSVTAAPAKQKKNQEDKKNDDNAVFVEQKTAFPGGEAGLLEWLKNNIDYPPAAAESGVNGTVELSFIINEDGTVSDVKVVKSLDPNCDQEAVSKVKKMPKWHPATENGKPVKATFNLPIRFKLAASKPVKSTPVKLDSIEMK